MTRSTQACFLTADHQCTDGVAPSPTAPASSRVGSSGFSSLPSFVRPRPGGRAGPTSSAGGLERARSEEGRCKKPISVVRPVPRFLPIGPQAATPRRFGSRAWVRHERAGRGIPRVVRPVAAMRGKERGPSRTRLCPVLWGEYDELLLGETEMCVVCVEATDTPTHTAPSAQAAPLATLVSPTTGLEIL